MSKNNTLTKESIKIYNRIRNKQLKLRTLNKVRELKEKIACLDLDIRAERERQSMKTSQLKEINVVISTTNKTPLDAVHKLERKKIKLLELFHNEQDKLKEVIRYKTHGSITDMLVDYYVKCKSLSELSGKYNLEVEVIEDIIFKYSTRVEVSVYDYVEHDKNLINYGYVDKANTLRTFINKDSYNKEEYNLLYTFLHGKHKLYYDSIINCFVRYEFSLFDLAKIYNISINALAYEVYSILLELDKYLKDNKYY